jgi:hypothetical protein
VKRLHPLFRPSGARGDWLTASAAHTREILNLYPAERFTVEIAWQHSYRVTLT